MQGPLLKLVCLVNNNKTVIFPVKNMQVMIIGLKRVLLCLKAGSLLRQTQISTWAIKDKPECLAPPSPNLRSLQEEY